MLLETRSLSRTFRQGEATVHALRDISLAVAPGEFVVITGPSGCGKTTLLQILGLLDDGFTGEVLFGGRSIRAASAAERAGLAALGAPQRARLRLTTIGFVFQDFQLLPALTTLDNVALPHWHLHGDCRAATCKARELLRGLGMEHRLRHKPHRLSGGEIQRAALARALINDPALLLADEPTAHLDELSARITLEQFERICAAGRAVVAASHDPLVVRRAHRCIRLRYGEIEPPAARLDRLDSLPDE